LIEPGRTEEANIWTDIGHIKSDICLPLSWKCGYTLSFFVEWLMDPNPFFCFKPSKSRTLTKVGKNTRCTSWKKIKLFCIYLLWILIFLTVKCVTVYIEYRTTIKPLFQYHHDITEILLKVAVNTITLTPLFKYIMCGLWHKSSLSICITWSEYEPIYI
jgi:hypothetical protein